MIVCLEASHSMNPSTAKNKLKYSVGSWRSWHFFLCQLGTCLTLVAALDFVQLITGGAVILGIHGHCHGHDVEKWGCCLICVPAETMVITLYGESIFLTLIKHLTIQKSLLMNCNTKLDDELYHQHDAFSISSLQNIKGYQSSSRKVAVMATQTWSLWHLHMLHHILQDPFRRPTAHLSCNWYCILVHVFSVRQNVICFCFLLCYRGLVDIHCIQHPSKTHLFKIMYSFT